MAGDSVSHRIEGDREVLAALEKLPASTLLELGELIGEELVNITEEAFEEEKDPVTGEDWEPSQRALEDGGQTLTDSAQLRRSITSEGFPDGSAIAGSNKVYTRIHNKGGKAGRGRKVTIPKRQFLGIPEDFPDRLSESPEVLDILGLDG